jgi:hypothetical protein
MFEMSNTSFFAAILQRDSLRAVTLTQPWASLVAVGAKRNETRSWPTTYQGPLAIHAAKGFPAWAEQTCESKPFRNVLDAVGYPWQPGMKRNRRQMPMGQIVAVGWLERVERISQNYPVDEIEGAFGNYTPGRYAWLFSRVYRLITPIAAKGSLGLWTWQPPETFWMEIQQELEKERTASCL